MKKDYIRDYATKMYREYAAAGEPTYELEKRRIYESELKRHARMDPAKAQAIAQKAVDLSAPYLLDILAADEAMKTLTTGKRKEIAAAVRAVYFPFPTAPLRRGEIARRVDRFAVECPADPRTVYRWLREARLLCAALRGLNISCQ